MYTHCLLASRKTCTPADLSNYPISQSCDSKPILKNYAASSQEPQLIYISNIRMGKTDLSNFDCSMFFCVPDVLV